MNEASFNTSINYCTNSFFILLTLISVTTYLYLTLSLLKRASIESVRVEVNEATLGAADLAVFPTLAVSYLPNQFKLCH